MKIHICPHSFLPAFKTTPTLETILKEDFMMDAVNSCENCTCRLHKTLTPASILINMALFTPSQIKCLEAKFAKIQNSMKFKLLMHYTIQFYTVHSFSLFLWVIHGNRPTPILMTLV